MLPLVAAHDYTAALQRLAALRAPVDAFFDGVMVIAFDVTEELRAREEASRLARYNELFAGVLAHEMVHVRRRHGVRNLIENAGLRMLMGWLTGGNPDSLMEGAAY